MLIQVRRGKGNKRVFEFLLPKPSPGGSGARGLSAGSGTRGLNGFPRASSAIGHIVLSSAASGSSIGAPPSSGSSIRALSGSPLDRTYELEEESRPDPASLCNVQCHEWKEEKVFNLANIRGNTTVVRKGYKP